MSLYCAKLENLTGGYESSKRGDSIYEEVIAEITRQQLEVLVVAPIPARSKARQQRNGAAGQGSSGAGLWRTEIPEHRFSQGHLAFQPGFSVRSLCWTGKNIRALRVTSSHFCEGILLLRLRREEMPSGGFGTEIG